MPDEKTVTLEKLREFYAAIVTGRWGRDHPAIRAAFAAVRREDFLGPGPWSIPVAGTYVQTPSDDPAHLYQDILVALDTNKTIHNGEPSLHARCIAAVDPKPGDHVVHIGCGTGYYSAIFAELVGADGRVDAYEIEGDLASAAAVNLRPWAHAAVRRKSASKGRLPKADIVYVNAGVTRPLDPWLDALNEGGRLLLPLVAPSGQGNVFLITRTELGFEARFVWFVWIIQCAGARFAEDEEDLTDALNRNARFVRSLRRSGTPDETSWYAWDGGWLSTRELP